MATPPLILVLNGPNLNTIGRKRTWRFILNERPLLYRG